MPAELSNPRPQLMTVPAFILLAVCVLTAVCGCEKVPTWDQLTGKEAAPSATAPETITATNATDTLPDTPASQPAPPAEPEPPKINSAEIIAAFLALPPGTVNDGSITQLLQATEGLDQIKVIKSSGEQGLTNRGLAMLPGLPALTDIDLSGKKLDDESFAQISKITSLEILQINGTPITDTGLNHLTALPRLKALYMAGCANLTPAGLSAIGQMPAIEDVMLNSVSAVNNESVALMSTARTLRHLHMNHCSLSDVGLLSLRNLDVIEALYIAETTVTGEGLAFAAKSELQNMKTLSMYNCPISLAGAKVINRCRNLEALVIGNIGMDDKGFGILTQGMTKLTYLRVKDCKNFVGAGLKSIKGCSNLQELLLENTGIVDQALPLMKGFKKLRTLDLSGTKVTQAAAQNLKAILPECNIRITGYTF